MTGREISTINESGLNFEIEPISLLYKQKDLSPVGCTISSVFYPLKYHN